MIDAHAHVWSRPLKIVAGARFDPQYDAPAEAFIANLDRNGLSGGLLIQPSFLGTDNSLMLDAVRRYPDRLKAVVVIDPASSDEDLAALEAQGAIGVRYNLVGLPLLDFTQGPYPAFHRRLADRGWHVELHREAHDLAMLVLPLLAQGVKVAIDHFGRPDTVSHAADPAFAQVLSWGREPRVWLKASAAYRCGGEPAAAALMPRVLDHFNATRVLWASDWPHTQHETVTYNATFDLFRRTVPDATVRRRILEQAPAELYPVSVTREQKASWIIAALVLVAVIKLHLLSALLAGMLVYELVHIGGSVLERHVTDRRAKLITVALLAVVVVTLLVVAGFALAAFLRDENSLAALANKMAEILENSRRSLPEWALAALPESIEAFRESAVAWLRDHAAEMQVVGKDAVVTAAHVLVGIVIGAMIALREVGATDTEKPLAAALGERCHRFAEAFRRIVFAQVRISALNTVFTAIYLLALLPMFGIHLPFAKTMVVVTFIAGLLPVIGNLVSNTVIVVVSLAHSPQTAVASLAFLVIIHKLEYFLNARIVGSRIQAQAWELLVAMLAMEAAFGLPGIVAAPIYYAYLKQELVDAGQV